MITLRRLAAAQYKGIQALDLTFPARGSFLIEGRNEAGKSTLFDAVHFALYGVPLVGDLAAAIHYGADEMGVRLALDVGGTQLAVRRGVRQTAKTLRAEAELEVRTGDDLEVVKGAREVTRRLQQELGGLTAETLLNSCLVAQKQLGRLETLTRASREEALTILLNLGKLTDVQARLRLRPEDDEQLRLARARVDLAHVSRELEALGLRRAQLARQLRLIELHAGIEQLSAFEAALAEARSAAAACEARLRGVRRQLEHIERAKAAESRWLRVLEAARRVAAADEQCGEAEGQVAEARAAAAALPPQRQELARFRVARAQVQALDDCRARIDALDAEADRIARRLRERAEQAERQARLEAVLADLRRRRRDLAAQIMQLAPLIGDLEASKERLSALRALAAELERLRQQRAALEELEAQAATRVEAEARLRDAEAAAAASCAALGTYEAQREAAKAHRRLQEVREALARWLSLTMAAEAAATTRRLLDDLALAVAGVEHIALPDENGTQTAGLRLSLVIDHPLTGALSLVLRLRAGAATLAEVRPATEAEVGGVRAGNLPSLGALDETSLQADLARGASALAAAGEPLPPDAHGAARRLREIDDALAAAPGGAAPGHAPPQTPPVASLLPGGPGPEPASLGTSGTARPDAPPQPLPGGQPGPWRTAGPGNPPAFDEPAYHRALAAAAADRRDVEAAAAECRRLPAAATLQREIASARRGAASAERACLAMAARCGLPAADVDALEGGVQSATAAEQERHDELQINSGRREGLQARLVDLDRSGGERTRELEECRRSLSADTEADLQSAQHRLEGERAACAAEAYRLCAAVVAVAQEAGAALPSASSAQAVGARIPAGTSEGRVAAAGICEGHSLSRNGRDGAGGVAAPVGAVDGITSDITPIREAIERQVEFFSGRVAVLEEQVAAADAAEARLAAVRETLAAARNALRDALSEAGAGADADAGPAAATALAGQRLEALARELQALNEPAVRVAEQEAQRAAGGAGEQLRRVGDDARALAGRLAALAAELDHPLPEAAVADGREPGALAAALAEACPEGARGVPARDETERQLRALHEQMGHLERGRQDARALLGDEPAMPLDEAQAALASLELEHAARRRAQDIVAVTRQRMISKVLPDTLTNMCLLLPLLTAGRYRHAELTPDYRLQVWDERKRGYVEKSLYSGGTQDQFSLALRLGFALAALPRELGTSPGFLFLDEPLSSFDQDRTAALIDLLTHGRIATFFQQVFLISHSQAFDPGLFSQHIVMEEGRVAHSTLP